MATYDPPRDYERQPSWSPITPTSPTGQSTFPDKDTFDVHAFVDHELDGAKHPTKEVTPSGFTDRSSGRIYLGLNAGPNHPDHEVNHIWKQVKKTLRNQLKEELRTELQNEMREELKAEVRRELKDELRKQTPHHQRAREAQGMIKTEEAVSAQQPHMKRDLFDPFAPVALGPIKPGFEDDDARAIKELDEAMKEVDERMAKMEEERERREGFAGRLRG